MPTKIISIKSSYNFSEAINENKQLKLIYDTIWYKSKPKLLTNHIVIDPYLADISKDPRRGYTLLVQLEPECTQVLSPLIENIKQLEPNQYHYPLSTAHITLLDIIPCAANLQFYNGQARTFQKILKKSLINIPSFSVQFKGVTASQDAIMVQGFAGIHIENIRTLVRQAFSAAKLPIQERRKSKLVHTCVTRFKHPLQNPLALVNYIENSRKMDLGTFKVNKLFLVWHDWYNRSEKTKVLAEYKLYAPG